MAEEKNITEESLAEHPEWSEAGLVVGDKIPKEKREKKNTVEVDSDVLQNLLKEVEAMRGLPEKIDKLTKENEMLVDVADKSRLATWQSRNNPQGLTRSARAWIWNGKLVKATLTMRNKAFTDVLGRVHTDQVLKVILEDNTEEEVAYDQFTKERELTEGDVIAKSETEHGMFYTLRFKDGKEYTVNYLFLN